MSQSADASTAARLYQILNDDIICIDAEYVEPGLACLYLLGSGGEYAVIETGTANSVPGVLRVLRERSVDPAAVRYVIPTHVHLDHAGGAGAMMALFENAELLVHPRGARHMVDPERLVKASMAVYGEALFRQLYGEITPVPASRVREMRDGEHVTLGQRRLLFRHTEGHARHHFCVWDEQSKGWFSGDMFGISYQWCRFDGGDFMLPSTSPTQFDPVAFERSLALLAVTRPEWMYLTHYGAVAFSERKCDQLLVQVRQYVEVADRVPRERLQEELTQLTLEMLREYVPAESVQECTAKIQFDMQLNAQGVADWLSRRDA
ncbi:MAG: MBL fold metallo-hydrolase [Pseudomonadota bacterium]